ncbi:MAG: hypothetical protein MK171_09855 [Pirellulales bacterium]|nr:hypothetical protein [Pirellulales bacterium]
MNVKSSKPLSAFGFLTVQEDPDHGFFGGYLVLSELGRPLEFHCSTPLLPNQAQKILYGATLRSYVLGEVIGQTLVEKSQLPVLAVLTDQAEMMSMADLRPELLLCVETIPEKTEMMPHPVEPTGLALEVAAEEVQDGTNECVRVCPDDQPGRPTDGGPKELDAQTGEATPATGAGVQSLELVLDTYRLWGSPGCIRRPDDLNAALERLAVHVELTEPFERVREAIREAQRVSTPPGDESHESFAA